LAGITAVIGIFASLAVASSPHGPGAAEFFVTLLSFALSVVFLLALAELILLLMDLESNTRRAREILRQAFISEQASDKESSSD